MSFFLCIINYAAALLAPTKVTSLRNALETRPPGTAVAVEAWVHGRRVMGGSMAFLTLGDGDDSHDVQAVLSRKHVRVAGPSFKQTVQLAHPGARVSLRGRIERHERGWPILVCERMKLLRCAPVPATVRRLLSAADEESVRRDEANNALMICSTGRRAAEPRLPLWRMARTTRLSSRNCRHHRFLPPTMPMLSTVSSLHCPKPRRQVRYPQHMGRSHQSRTLDASVAWRAFLQPTGIRVRSRRLQTLLPLPHWCSWRAKCAEGGDCLVGTAQLT